MKKGIIVVFLILIVILASCSNPNSPKGIVQTLYKNVELVEYIHPEAKRQMALENGKVKTIKETIIGDAAAVTVTFENGKQTQIEFKKNDGFWKYHLSD